MCNPEYVQQLMQSMGSMGGMGQNPNSIPSLPIPGVGATSTAPNGMPPTQGGPQQVSAAAMGQPLPPLQMPQPPQMPQVPGAASIPPAGPGMPQPPVGALARMVSGGAPPNGRGPTAR